MTLRLAALALSLCLSTAHADLTVIVDAGHGGTSIVDESSPNNAQYPARGKAQFLEKDLTLSMAEAVADAINSARGPGPRIRALLTRTRDVNVGMAERARIATEANAAAFVSIHFNASGNHTAKGPLFMIQDAQRGNRNVERDTEFGQRLVRAIAAVSTRYDAGSTPRGRMTDRDFKGGRGSFLFKYLRRTEQGQQIPACFLEVDFLDNPAVVKWLLLRSDSRAIQKQIAQAIAEATVAYLRAQNR